MMMPLSKDRGSEKRGSEDVCKDGPHLRCFVVLYFFGIQWSDKLWLEVVRRSPCLLCS
jgi:hypothetical protein